ncbi:KR domain family protein [Aspergillus niger]|uniref:KR domain family protein n=2 Tax=Aspergillus niger TaxID=5061 RepID=A0A505ICC7_ASPNG|nr:KR domain family protein [Aspergillus niger]
MRSSTWRRHYISSIWLRAGFRVLLTATPFYNDVRDFLGYIGLLLPSNPDVKATFTSSRVRQIVEAPPGTEVERLLCIREFVTKHILSKERVTQTLATLRVDDENIAVSIQWKRQPCADEYPTCELRLGYAKLSPDGLLTTRECDWRGKALSLEDIVELVNMRAAANKGARLVEAIQFMEDIKGWDTAVAGVCTIAEQALRGKPNSIEEFNGMPRSSRREYTRKAGELHSKVSAIAERNWMAIGAHLSAELITKLTFSKKVKAFAEFPEAEQGTTIRRLNQKVYKRCAAPPGIGRNRDPVSTMQL